MDIRDQAALTFLAELRRNATMSPHMTQDEIRRRVAFDTVAAYAMADVFMKTKELLDRKQQPQEPAPAVEVPPPTTGT